MDITVPVVGESISEGTLVRWLKKNGDSVQVDEPVFELETEKATSEVPAPASGILTIDVAEGKRVDIGTVVGHIDPTAAKVSPAPVPKKTTPPATPVSENPRPVANSSKTNEANEVILSPATRRAAEESGVDVRRIAGTGRGGRITKEDVLAHQDAPPTGNPESLTLPPGGSDQVKPVVETRRKMSGIRQRIAERLVASQQTTATLTTFNEADMSAIMTLRAEYKERFQKKHGVSLGFMSFFVRACVEALRAFPLVNSRIDNDDIVTPNGCHIGVAVSTERGLMVPVLHDADKLGFAQVEKGIADLALKARAGKIAVADLQGGSFTITNGGVFGSLLSTPILNPPQSAILGMHAIQKRPIAVNDQVVIRPMMYLALSYDHRLIDGSEAVRFLVRIKECLENPERLLLEV